MTTPVIRWLQEQLGATIHYATKAAYAELLSNNPRIAKLSLLADGSWSSLVTDLRAQKFDLIVDLHCNLRSRRLRFELKAKSVGYQKQLFNKMLFFTLRINRYNASHVIDRYAEALASIGIRDDAKGMELYLGDQSSTSVDLPSRFIAISAGGSSMTKRIPYHIIRDIIDRYPDVNFILLGGEDVDNKLKDYEGRSVVNLIGRLSLIQSAEVISKAEQVITGDTGLMHIAAAFDRPTITIWGSTDPIFGFYPRYKSQNLAKAVALHSDISCRPCSRTGRKQCPLGHLKCLNEFPVDRLDRYLGSNSSDSPVSLP